VSFQKHPSVDIVGAHVTRSDNNFQSCIVGGIKNLHKEINKHLTLSAAVNQIESYWLLPLFTQTMKHEDQGMVSNIACPIMASKILKALKRSVF
jgi:hypothetical protein